MNNEVTISEEDQNNIIRTIGELNAQVIAFQSKLYKYKLKSDLQEKRITALRNTILILAIFVIALSMMR